MDGITTECAVVGAGPAGFYCAEALLQAHEGLRVTLVERLPAVFGLARYGVAPDHLKLKQVCSVFDRIARHPRLALAGNVDVPGTVPLSFLREQFHAVVLATGAPQARSLGIEGEGLPGSHSAARFVAWYNGHPDAADFAPGLGCESAVVVGQGNVALDIARVLLLPPERRHASDMATHALQALAGSSVRTVHVVGRRGPWATRFSVKELREFEQLEDVSLHIHAGVGLAGQSAPPDADDAARQAGEFFRRNAAASTLVACNPPHAGRNVHFHFGLSPTRLAGRLAVESAHFSAAADSGLPQSGVCLPCGLFIRSIGTVSAGMHGLGQDPASGAIANHEGQVLDADNQPVDGLFVTGWARRGATGVIGSNRDDGSEVAAKVLAWLGQCRSERRHGRAALQALLAMRSHAMLDQPGWARVDAAERAAGAAAGRPRVKLVRVQELLAAAAG